MTRLVLLRHGPTDWNASGCLQGRNDQPLSDAGRHFLRNRKLPAAFSRRRWYASPLRRAAETANLLGVSAIPEPALTEMDWGEYEGYTLGELQARYGAAFSANEALGLDLLPPHGESPRQVQARLRPWLRKIAAEGLDAGAVTHKGVIRAILSLAYDWPMLGKPPVKLDWSCLHDFDIDVDGLPRPLTMNIVLE